MLCTYTADTFHLHVILPLVAGRGIAALHRLQWHRMDGLLAHQMLGGYVQIRLVLIGQHLVDLIADGATQILLGHMEVPVLAVSHPHPIIHRFTRLLVIFGLLDARRVGVEVLKLASFAVLQWNRKTKTLTKISQTWREREIGWQENEGMCDNETYSKIDLSL